ncbi:TrkA C-terminal domain-containing protein [Rufibacter ruber]|uniref:TrkA C-terminal domain-containing protein n=1 Tax=Rufibacter ruber TaxID=1783499 RepID=UPI000A9281AB|nr:TrkA C-terminal domain-containing protein [Rufibacter ruber]
MMVTYAGPIALITLVTLVGKAISITGGGLISGQGLKTSIQSGMSVSQIGEFSFIIATLGLTLKVTSDFLYPVAVAVSAVTTFTTPYMIKFSEPLYRLVERLLPAKWQKSLNEYSSGTQIISTTSDWKLVLRSYVLHMVVYCVIIISIILLSAQYLNPFIVENVVNGNWGDVVTTAITFLVMAPFLWALAVYHPQKEAQGRIWANRNYRSLVIVLEFGRVAVAILFIGVLLNQFFSVQLAIVVGLVMVAFLMMFSQKIQQFYIRIENRFVKNLNARELQEAVRMHHTLTPWDVHLTSFEIDPGSAVVGKSLLDLQVREKYGVNVAVIERGDRTITAPTRNELIFPNDKVFVVGEESQTEAFRQFIQTRSVLTSSQEEERESVRLQKLQIRAGSVLLHKSIRNSGVREKTKGLIVGVERKGRRMLNPDSELVFEEGDIVWIVGLPRRIKQLEVASPEPGIPEALA